MVNPANANEVGEGFEQPTIEIEWGSGQFIVALDTGHWDVDEECGEEPQWDSGDW